MLASPLVSMKYVINFCKPCAFPLLTWVYSFCSHLRHHPVHRLHCGKVHHHDRILNCLRLHSTEFYLNDHA